MMKYENKISCLKISFHLKKIINTLLKLIYLCNTKFIQISIQTTSRFCLRKKDHLQAKVQKSWRRTNKENNQNVHGSE